MSFLHIDRIMQFKSFHSKTKTYLFYMVNIMAAGVCPGDERSLDISNHDIDRVKPG